MVEKVSVWGPSALPDGTAGSVVEHLMYPVDAREAVIRDPDNWTTTPPDTREIPKVTLKGSATNHQAIAAAEGRITAVEDDTAAMSQLDPSKAVMVDAQGLPTTDPAAAAEPAKADADPAKAEDDPKVPKKKS